MGNPIGKKLLQVVSNNFGINNYPVNSIDISNADVIYGPNLRSVRRKIVRHKPERVHGETISIPNGFYKLHQHMSLTVDVMFVNRIHS